jgi:hypothetical protein
LADPIGLAPQIVFQRLGVQGTAAVDDEGLIFLDGGAGGRLDAPGARGGTKKLETALAGDGFTIACGQPGF